VITAAVLLAVGGLLTLALVIGSRWLDGYQWRRSLVAFRLGLPLGLSADDVAAWLAHIAASTHAVRFGFVTPPPVALEVTATAGGIAHTLLVPSGMQGAVLSGLRAALPGMRLEAAPDYRRTRPHMTVAAEGRLSSLSRPLAHDRAERASASLLAALQPLQTREQVLLQWIFVGAVTPRPVSSRGNAATVLDLLRGEGPTADSEALRAARLKQQQGPLLQAVVRLGVSATSRARTWQLFGWVWGTLRGLNAPGVRLVRRSLPSWIVVDRLSSLRLPLTAWPMILNTRELAGLLGLPLGTMALPGLPRNTARQLPPPISMPTSGTVIAVSTPYPGMTERPLAITTTDRLRHTWIIGPTGVGKSVLLCGQIVQDMEAGRGVVAIDPKGGDLIADVLDRVPEGRRDDVVVIEPGATDWPVGLNVLEIAQGEHAAELAVDHLVHLMASLWHGSWGPRTSDVLRNALLTLTHTRAVNGSLFTLVELPELLLNPGFRRFVTSQPTVPAAVRPFWESYEVMSDGERAAVIGPSLNKLRSFTTRTALRLMLGQSQGIRLDEVFTKRRIILMSLPAGVIGTETAALAGSLVMAGLWQAILARVTVPAERRHPVMIYLDEFQEVLRLPVSLTDMLAQARGFGVGLVLSHQYLGQLGEAIRTAVLGTVRTQIAFQVEYDDAKTLARRFAPLTQADLSGLAAYEIAMRPCVNGATLGPVTGRTLPLGPATTDGAALAHEARQRFGRARAEVEAALASRIEGAVRRRVGRRRPGGDE
jgi:Type IV secretion-system coupling protein DNA-binding domain